MVAVVEAAGNLVFQLIMNSVRELYLPNASSFAAVVADRAELAPLYQRAAEAIRAGSPTRLPRRSGSLPARRSSGWSAAR